MNSSEIVAITGITGYIGAEICRQVLEAGYMVRGLTDNIMQASILKEKVLPCKDRVNIMEASLNSSASSWEQYLQGVDYVIHIATPIEFSRADIMSGAIKGVENVMRSAIKNKVKKVVLTSSAAACSDTDKYIDENSWADKKDSRPYAKCKAAAELLAWKIYREQKEEVKTELTCMLPVFAFGPTIQNKILSSLKVVKMILLNKMVIANYNIPIVDIRDVANAHLLALKDNKSNGQRYLLHNKTMWLKDIAKIVSQEAYKYGISVNYSCCWNIKVKILAKFIHGLEWIAHNLGVVKIINNSKSVKELGMNYIPAEKTIIEAMYSCIHNGALNKI